MRSYRLLALPVGRRNPALRRGYFARFTEVQWDREIILGVPEDNVQTTRRAFDYINRGDREALRELTAPSAEIVPLRAALEGTVYRGENSFDEFWAAVDESWETIGIEAEEITDYGDRVLVIGRLRGRAKGTDVEVDSPMAWVMAIADGKMTKMRTYLDIDEARRDAVADS
jgi:ketosteroid isomerase-like protein